MIKIKCPHCPKELNLADEYAGKKVRCPACKEVLAVPAATATAVRPPTTAPAPVPVRKGAPPPPLPKRRSVEDEEEIEAEVEPEEAEDDEPRPRKKGKRRRRRGEYADCPHCGAEGDAKRVAFTWWGGALGPWMLCHVACNACGKCYNGRTGKTNEIGIAIYTIVGLLIGLMLGAVAILVLIVSRR